MTDNRVILLEKIHNFRDYGGYAAGDGRLRTGLLYRSAQHFSATPGDLAQIENLGLTTVVDLRGAKEREAHPCPRPERFDARIIFSDGETAGLPPHLAAALNGTDRASMIAATSRIYRKLPFRPTLMALMRQYFDALATRDGSSLIHCLAGKDRTGIAVWLFHHAMGVHPDDAMADYLLTNSVGDQEARVAAGAAAIRERYGAISDEGLRVIMGVSPDYIHSAQNEIVENFGSIDNFLNQELGVDQPRKNALRARLVES